MMVDMSRRVDTLEGVKTLSDLCGPQGLVLYFYPKDMTPGCTKQACDLGASYQDIRALGWQIAGVSADSVGKHAQFSERYALPFDLIADTEHQLADVFHTWVEKSLFGHRYHAMERSTFVLDPQGTVLKEWRKVSPLKHHSLLLDYLRTRG